MKTVLHVGAGNALIFDKFPPSEWLEVRLDIDPKVKPDIISNITNMDVPNGEIDVVYSSHNIEHLYAHEVPLALGEFYRVLKPTGAAHIMCPDLQAVAAEVVQNKLANPVYNSPAGPISPVDIIFGHRDSIAKGNLFMAHKTGFTASTLARHLRDAGFREIKVTREEDYSITAIATKLPKFEADILDIAPNGNIHAIFPASLAQNS